MKRLFCLILAVTFIQCSQFSGGTDETISDEKPLAVEIKRERSFFQAEKIKQRLLDKGLDAYVMSVEDSTQSGQWYSIMVGATADSAAIDTLRNTLSTDFALDSLRFVDLRDSTQNLILTDTLEIKEAKRIDINRPNLPEPIYKVAEQFPNSNMFYIQKINLINCQLDKQANKINKMMSSDLPRGISIQKIISKADAWAEAIYTDNLYGDQITMDIIKLAPDHGIAVPPVSASGFPVGDDSDYQLEIADYFALLILDTGEYAIETKEEIAVDAFTLLKGYKVVIETSGKERTYLILVDSLGEYVVFCQSTQKSTEDLKQVMKLIGKGVGLNEYDEFYNSFYLLSDHIDSHDHFLYFSMNKLDWSYAKQKGYAKWAKLMVGHWAADYNFYHTEKGYWACGFYDLITEHRASTVDSVYDAAISKDRRITVYGRTGHFIEYYNKEEVNFTFSRYLARANNYDNLTKRDLVDRAEQFQFIKGGYQPTRVASTADSAQSM